MKQPNQYYLQWLTVIIFVLMNYSISNAFGDKNPKSDAKLKNTNISSVNNERFNGFSIGIVGGINYPLVGSYNYNLNIDGETTSYPAKALVGSLIGLSLKTSSHSKALTLINNESMLDRSDANPQWDCG